MTNHVNVLLLFSLLLGVSFGHTTTGRTAHGLVGIPITMYKPTCAFACRAAISSAQLNCSTVEMAAMEGMSASFSTSPKCYATDDFFLQTLAWCISSRCTEEPVWQLEKYWLLNVAGIQPGQPNPKEPYEAALLKVSSPPTVIFNSTLEVLNSTQVVDDSDWLPQYETLFTFEKVEDNHEKYGYFASHFFS